MTYQNEIKRLQLQIKKHDYNERGKNKNGQRIESILLQIKDLKKRDRVEEKNMGSIYQKWVPEDDFD